MDRTKIHSIMSKFPMPVRLGSAFQWVGSDLLEHEEMVEPERLIISLKQVPDVLALAGCLDKPISGEYEELVNQGIPLVYQLPSGEVVDINPPTERLTGSEISESVRSFLSGSEPDVRSNRKITNVPPKKAVIKVNYEDPWRIFRWVAYCDMKEKPLPQITVVPTTSPRLLDPIPLKLLSKESRGKARNAIDFTRLSTTGQMELLMGRTHWGRLLSKWVNDDVSGKTRDFARELKKTIQLLLSGGYPTSIKRNWKSMFEGKPVSVDPRKRSFRFLELLKTVNGIFVQRFLAMPAEMWTWEKFDRYTLMNLAELISDEFIDGPMKVKTFDLTTAFELLKERRKKLKESLLREAPPPEERKTLDWLWHFDAAERRIKALPRAHALSMMANLVQTRGAGTPPPLVVLKAKMKFLKVVSTPSQPLTETNAALIKAAVDKVISKIPSSAFSGLTTKARVSAATTACWEKTRLEGGTIHALNELVKCGVDGTQAPIRDLVTGRILRYRSLEKCGSVGTYVFWMCLQKCMETPLVKLRYAYVTVVSEPGKARTVTKASAYLKVVLDLISKICSYPLSKIESSASGMSKDAHGWNFFRNLTSKFREEAFPVEDITVTGDDDPDVPAIEAKKYGTVFVSSSDLNTATDFMSHEVAKILAGRWMKACGLPPFLIGFANRTCFEPRWIVFKAKNAFKMIGEEFEESETRKILLVRGVMMGDPLTKPVMHLVHAANREIPTLCVEDLAVHFRNPFQVREWITRPLNI